MSTATPLARIPVGIMVERLKAQSAWIDHVWRPVAVLVGHPDAAPWTKLAGDGESATFYAGATDIELYRSETTYYRDNLHTEAPALWVVLRPTGVEPPYEILLVTANPAEGEASTEAGTDLVDTVPMPDRPLLDGSPRPLYTAAPKSHYGRGQDASAPVVDPCGHRGQALDWTASAK